MIFLGGTVTANDISLRAKPLLPVVNGETATSGAATSSFFLARAGLIGDSPAGLFSETVKSPGFLELGL